MSIKNKTTKYYRDDLSPHILSITKKSWIDSLQHLKTANDIFNLLKLWITNSNNETNGEILTAKSLDQLDWYDRSIIENSSWVIAKSAAIDLIATKLTEKNQWSYITTGHEQRLREKIIRILQTEEPDVSELIQAAHHHYNLSIWEETNKCPFSKDIKPIYTNALKKKFMD